MQPHIVAIFVVHFDVTKGNVVAWQHPQDLDLEGIEFQAVCSGLHRIASDVILFSRQNAIGLSVFENRPSEHERGAEMKAIGLLVEPFDSHAIVQHIPFLKHALNQCMHHSLDYNDLVQYYTKPLSVSAPSLQTSLSISMDQSVHQNLRQMMTMTSEPLDGYGMDVWSDFVCQFGPNLLVLWKAALLRKRILLIHTPPMEIACKYVNLISLLGQVPSSFQPKSIQPRFTIGVNDIPHLNHQGYIACTPDVIFETKPDLYDLLITLPSSNGHRDRILNDHPPILSVQPNQADRLKYHIMSQKPTVVKEGWISQLASCWTGLCYALYDRPSSWQTTRPSYQEQEGLLSFQEDEIEDATEITSSQLLTQVQHQQAFKDQHLLRVFHGLTECLLSKLRVMIETETIHLYPRDMVQLGLDPQLDIDFLTELSLLYFNQPIYIHGLHNSIGHLSDTLCGCCKQQIHI